MPQIKLFTVSQVRDWLLHNREIPGLSEQIIAPQRAWSIIHNPYIKEDDTMLSAIYIDNSAVAFTAAFPEKNPLKCENNQLPDRVFWFSTLYCNPQYRGLGLGLIAIGSLAENYGYDASWDRWGLDETVSIFTHFGHQTIYSKRYVFQDKIINTNSLKGKLANAQQFVEKQFRQRRKPSVNQFIYQTKCSSFVDGTMYQFMQKYRRNDLFCHSQQMLNWETQYPFSVPSVLSSKIKDQNFFFDSCKTFECNWISIYHNDNLVGVYMIKRRNDALSINYLYYSDDGAEVVFNSIIDCIIISGIRYFETENKDLAECVDKYVYFPKHSISKISLSLPKSVSLPQCFTMQLGDGDSWA